MSSFQEIAAMDKAPDSTTGLSEMDIALIRRSWALVADRKVLKQNSIEFFIQLFRAFPGLMKYFSALQGLSEAELRTSSKLRAHAAAVMYMISSYVDNLDDVGTLVEMVTKVSVTHIARNITEQDFKDLASIFGAFLKSVIGEDNVTAETEVAWNKLLGAQVAVYRANVEAAANK